MSSEAGYDEFDITKEQRGDRLWWVIWGVGAMLLVIGALYLNERGEIRLLHVFVLNLLVYGTLLYVDNLEDLKKPWLWKAVLFTIPIHIVCVVLLWLWDADVPNSGWAIMNRILTFFIPELVVMAQILDHFKPAGSPASQRPQLLRPSTWKRAVAPENVLTLPDDEDALDPGKASRRANLHWAFIVVSALLIAADLFWNFVLRGFALYVVQAAILTGLCYGKMLYVEGFRSLKSTWLWIAALAACPFHIASMGVLVGFDRAAPHLSANPVAFLLVILGLTWLETRLMDQISYDYMPLDPAPEMR